MLAHDDALDVGGDALSGLLDLGHVGRSSCTNRRQHGRRSPRMVARLPEDRYTMVPVTIGRRWRRYPRAGSLQTLLGTTLSHNKPSSDSEPARGRSVAHMTDTVLQSFCERCGSRYTFTGPEPKPAASEESRGRLGRFGRRAPDAPADVGAPAVSTASPSSEQFADTFHFCLDCRQYACTKCWNPEGGGCLTCRPPSRDGEATRGDAAKRSPFAATSEGSSWTAGGAAAAADTAGPAAGSEGELDEWGRPRQSETSSHDHREVEKPSQEGKVDPWRGVIFSDDDYESPDVAPTTAETPSEPAAPTIDFKAERSVEAPPQAWPETDLLKAGLLEDASPPGDVERERFVR